MGSKLLSSLYIWGAALRFLATSCSGALELLCDTAAMRTSLVCLSAIVPCATSFVVHSPPLSVSSAASCTASRSREIAVFSRESTRRRATSLWGKKLPPDEQAALDLQLAMDAAEEAKNNPQSPPVLDDFGNEIVKEEDDSTKDLWGREMNMVIGQDRINYMALSGDRNPAVLYLPAFDAPARDYKAERLRSYCEKEDYPFISMEWFGVGENEGSFELGTISRWKQDAISLIDKLLPEAYQEVIIVGGGVGGWIATLIALERPEKVGGIVGLAADPDFTENLLMRYLPKAKIDEIFEKGVATIAWGERSYPVSKVLIEDARDNLVLEGPVGGLPITCPVRLIHGLNDEEVPYTVSLDLARRVQTKNVNLHLIKSANHHLDKGSILNIVISSLEECIINYVPHEMPPLVDSI